MTWVAILWLGLWSSPGEVEALRALAPGYLTASSAGEHLGAARAAAAARGVDAAALLAIAYHESRFEARTRTREPGDRVSCGVMTPEPRHGCAPGDLTVLGGYLAGAEHLRRWMDACHAADGWRHDVDDEAIQSCALWAYAGGRGFRAFCAARGSRPRGCDAVARFEAMAGRIRRALEAAR